MMRTSAPGTEPQRGAREARVGQASGFTLLEVLVVLVIAAILVAAAGLSIGTHPQRDLREDAERLAVLFESANDEAHLEATVWAWQPLEHGYRFVERRNGGWVTATEAPFAPRRWSAPVDRVAIQVQGSGAAQQQVLFGRDAYDSPVSVTLSAASDEARVVALGDGRYEAR